MRKRKNKDGSFTYEYRASCLEEEIAKCEKEIARIEKVIPYLEFSFNEAKKAYESKKNRINDLKGFVSLANKEIEGKNK